jgi:hypothetical protein
MPLAWVSRGFFALVAAVAFAVVLSGTACTRWGQPGPITPSLAPIVSVFVNPTIGSDSSGNGSSLKPYKTLTKAILVVSTAKSVSTQGVTIYLSGGDYTVANGEKFPIVVPTAVTILGTGFGRGPHAGTFIDGFGEDTLLELLLHAPAHSNYSTMDIAPGTAVSVTDVYVGSTKLSLPGNAEYVSMDDLGTLSGTTSSLGAGILSSLPAISGVLVPGGTFSCISCLIRGNAYGVVALSVALPSASPTASPYSTSSPYGSLPSVTLSHAAGDATISAKLADIITDGSVDVTASNEHFEQSRYAFSDALHAIVNVSSHGAIDFGGGAAQSAGGNTFLGARKSEIFVGRRFESVIAFDDLWNPGQQGANGSGLYPKTITFRTGTAGKNVTIPKYADGATVTVGPAPAPTPTPSTTPSSYPSPTPT